jgi:transposase InsO family protein
VSHTLKAKYTTTERERAIERGNAVGPNAAARELGIPAGTIAYWQHMARQTAVDGSVTGTAPAPPSPAPISNPTKQSGSTAAERPKKRVAKAYTPSQRAEALELAAKVGVAAAARQLGMTPFSIYDWRRQLKQHAAGEATATHPLVDKEGVTSSERDRLIIAEWRAHPGLGPSQIRNQMRRQGLKVSIHTVRVVLEANGYVTPRVRRQVVHDQVYEAVRPNHLWHLDFLHRYVHKQKVYVLLIIDDYSRFIVGCALWDGERATAVIDTFLTAVSRHGKPEKALSDGGSAFYAWKGVGAFTRELADLEVDQLIATTPSSNGKLEVLNANIQKELFNTETFFDLGEAQRRLTTWVQFYNFRRTHHALGGLLVPADRYFGRSDEVLGHLEAGRSADGVGEPVAVGERHLDLFRISSYRGQVEVTLLGQRLTVTGTKPQP